MELRRLLDELKAAQAAVLALDPAPTTGWGANTYNRDNKVSRFDLAQAHKRVQGAYAALDALADRQAGITRIKVTIGTVELLTIEINEHTTYREVKDALACCKQLVELNVMHEVEGAIAVISRDSKVSYISADVDRDIRVYRQV